MGYTEFKKKLKNRLKTYMHGVADKFTKNSKLSEKSLGVIIRTMHMCTPVNCIFIMLFAPNILCKIVIGFLLGVLIMFYTFDSCFLSVIEQKLCNDDFVIIDPSLELCNLEVTPQNRYYISNIIGATYLATIFLIYYVRFYWYNTTDCISGCSSSE
jgi:hypothetical protein